MNETNRRRRFRLPRPQFGLTAMIWLTAASALLIWWWLTPAPVERQLAGGWRIRVPQRTLVDDRTGEEVGVPHGPFVVIDQQGRVRCRGSYHEGLASGYWKYYHDNGRKSLAGPCRGGGPAGRWTQWGANGSRVAVTEYGPPLRLSEPERELPPGSTSFNLLNLNPLEQSTANHCYPRRQGAALRWWDNGRPRFTGQFDRDRRTGRWRFWRRDGTPLAEGSYRQGRRHGRWTFHASEGSHRVVHYLDGDEGPPLEQRLPILERQLTSGNWSQARKAARLLASCDAQGLPSLKQGLRHADRASTILVLRQLKRSSLYDEEVLSLLERLSRSDNGTIAVRATSALYEFDSDRRTEWGMRLLETASDASADRSLVVEAFTTASEVDLAQLELALSDRRPEIRRVAGEILGALASINSHSVPREARPEVQRRRRMVRAIVRRAADNAHADVVESPFRQRSAGGGGGGVF